jgi:hypothetical protein
MTRTKTEAMTLRLPPDLKRRLEKIADSMGHSLTKTIVALLAHASEAQAQEAVTRDHETWALTWLIDKDSHIITARDLQRGSRLFRTMTRFEVEAVLAKLEARGWLVRQLDPMPARWDTLTRWAVHIDRGQWR